MAAGDPIAADAKRTEKTPYPFSAREAWDLDTAQQEMLSTLIQVTPFISVLQEFALAMSPGVGLSESCALGMQIGARNIIEKILNMTKERVTHNAGANLEKKASQIGAGIPRGRQLRPIQVPVSRRLSGPIRPESPDPAESPPEPT